MSKILMFYPSMDELYKKTILEKTIPYYIPLGLLTIATPLIENDHEVKLIDLNFASDIKKTIEMNLKIFNPEYVVLSFNTPLYSQSIEIARIAKEYNPDIRVIAGGAHVTFDYEDTLKRSQIDIAVIGEADFKLLEIVESIRKKKGLRRIKGIAYKKKTGSSIKVHFNERDPYMIDLDKVPFPSIHLIDIHRYKIPHTYTKKNPVFPLEMSRGCVFNCIYCNKTVFGKTFRKKSPERIIQDMKKVKKLGFKEVHVMDDCFSTDLKWAKRICRLMIKTKEIKGLLFNCNIGVRANQVDLELFKLMKRAGFHNVAFGVESGSQRILDNIKKDMKLKDYIRAFKLARKAGLQTMGYFLIGSPGETPKDVRKTMKFVRKIKPDLIKYSLLIPLPNTELYHDWIEQGYIKSFEWDCYSFYSKKKVYDHPNMSWPTMYKLLREAYRDFYLSPQFMARRLLLTIKNRTILEDMNMFASSVIGLFRFGK